MPWRAGPNFSYMVSTGLCKGDCLARIGQNSVWVLGRTDAPDWYGQKRRSGRQCYLVSFGKDNTLQF